MHREESEQDSGSGHWGGWSEQDSGSGHQDGSEQDSGSGPFGTQDQCITGVQSRDQDQSRNQNFPDTVGSWLDYGGHIRLKNLGPVESVL